MKLSKKTKTIGALAVFGATTLTGAGAMNQVDTLSQGVQENKVVTSTLEPVSYNEPSTILQVSDTEKLRLATSSLEAKTIKLSQVTQERDQYKKALDTISQEQSNDLTEAQKSVETLTAERDSEKKRADDAEARIKELEAQLASKQGSTSVDTYNSALGDSNTKASQNVSSNLQKTVDSIDDTQRKAVVESALSQLGVNQDCTMLVTNSLKSIGINHHGWPESYISLGTQVSKSEAKPGDIIVWYDNGTKIMMANGKTQQHVALVVANDNGNITAVHGGWNGNTTALWSDKIAGDTSEPIYISIKK